MNTLYYGENASAFDKVVNGFAPANVKPVKDVISPIFPPKQLASKLERDFARLDEISRLLKSRHNDCSPLFMLPLECIGTIIHFVASVEPPQWDTMKAGIRQALGLPKVAPNSLGWMRLGHVCQRLGGIVISMRALWAASAFSLSPASFKDVISHAGGVPLTIDLAGRSRLSPEVLSVIREHIHDAAVVKFGHGTLDVIRPSRPWPFNPAELSKESFPFLDSLSLVHERIYEISEEVYSSDPINAPRLRHLFAKNTFVPCELSSLESYELLFAHSDRVVPPLPPTSIFVDMLRDLSNVRILTLDNCIPALHPTAKEQISTFEFPRLRELRLGGSLPVVESLWTCLEIPAETRIRMDVEEAPSRLIESLPMQLAFFDAISTHFRSPRCPPVTALSMDDDQEDDMVLRLVLATPEHGARQSGWTGPLSSGYDFLFDLTYEGWNPENLIATSDSMAPFLAVLQHIHSKFELKDLAVLELASSIPFSSTQWRQTLSPFTNITTLAMDPFPPELGFWDFLCPQTNTFPPAFRKLETIMIQKTEDFFMESDDVETDLDEPASWSSIVPGLKRRAAIGFGISRLDFANFTVPARDKDDAERLLQDLRAVVPDVVGQVTELQSRGEDELVGPGFPGLGLGLGMPMPMPMGMGIGPQGMGPPLLF